MKATIVCLKWGDLYPAEYVNVLFSALSKHMVQPFNFVCITDDSQGLNPGIDVRDLPIVGIPPEKYASGAWPKLHIFSKDVMKEEGPIIYIDVDVIIVDGFDQFFDRLIAEGGLHIVRRHNRPLEHLLPINMRPDRGGNGSIIGFFLKDHAFLYDQFLENMEKTFAENVNDQEYISAYATKLSYWPDKWTPGFKAKVCSYYPFNRFIGEPKIPKDAAVVVMAGEPNPREVIKEGDYEWGGKRRRYRGPVSWIRDYWLEHGGVIDE